MTQSVRDNFGFETKIINGMSANENKPGGEVILYQTEDLQTRLEVRLEGETVWLTQAQMAELFQTTIQNVSMHIRNVFHGRGIAGSVSC